MAIAFPVFLPNANFGICGNDGGNDGKWESTFAAPMVMVDVAKVVNLVVVVIATIIISVSVITSAAVVSVVIISIIATLTKSSLPCAIVIVRAKAG